MVSLPSRSCELSSLQAKSHAHCGSLRLVPSTNTALVIPPLVGMEAGIRELKRGRQGIRDVQVVNAVGENRQADRAEEEREERENNAADDGGGGIQNIRAGVDDVRERIPLENGAERRENAVGENEAEREPVRAEHGPDERENVIEEDAHQREAVAGAEVGAKPRVVLDLWTQKLKQCIRIVRAWVS